MKKKDWFIVLGLTIILFTANSLTVLNMGKPIPVIVGILATSIVLAFRDRIIVKLYK